MVVESASKEVFGSTVIQRGTVGDGGAKSAILVVNYQHNMRNSHCEKRTLNQLCGYKMATDRNGVLGDFLYDLR